MAEVGAAINLATATRRFAMKLNVVLVIACVLLCLPLAPSGADEGMWLFSRPPRELLKKKYDFTLTDDWLMNAQKASVRFNNGGSGGFVSPDGLVVTNHHIGADSILKLSGKGKDLHRDGFYAAKREDELKCPDLELNVLQEMIDVTKEVQAAVKPDMKPAEAAAARRAIIAQIAKESQAKTGLRSDVVMLYRGAEYHLYRYKKYTDVRLVMAPEAAVASFGGDVDNFEYPRHDLDICFFRVYEDGKPAGTPHHFKWSTKGPADGDLVFVTGHPGTTNRLETLAHLKHRRDVVLPYTLQMLRQREALLLQYSATGPEQKRAAQADLARVANARKALTGQYHGLLNPEIMAAKKKMEKGMIDLRNREDPWVIVANTLIKLDDFQGSALKSREEMTQNALEFERRYSLIARGDAFDSKLFKIARHLVRLAVEREKGDGQRLPEYRSSAQASLQIQLFSPAPISTDLERVKLAGSLAFLAENLGGEHSLVVKTLAGKSTAQRAADLIAGTKLSEVAERKRLFDGGKKAIAESTDPMVKLALLVDDDARKMRQKVDEAEEVLQQAYAAIAKATFDKYGTAIAPDATFTLRLAFGVVKGYHVDGVDLAPFTTFAGLYARTEEQGNEEPFRLPKRWAEGKAKLDPKAPLNFVSTADTIGGNSGSPVLNRAGELVGVNFDRNRYGLVRNFVYTEVQARHICVNSRGVLEALEKLYEADGLVRELTR
jgi:Peptidase S46